MGVELFLHNQIAYESALKLMDDSGKAAVIHPTGTGKSFIAFKLAEEHPDSRIFWLAPSEYIYQTQLENFVRAENGGKAAGLSHVLFMTYARLMKSDAAAIAAIHPDYIILDEFHRCGALEWGKGVQRLLSAFPEAKILGLSATNIRYLDNQRNMAEELFDGCVASEMTLGEAIVKNILPAPTYVTSLYSYEDELKKWDQKVSAIQNAGLRKVNEEILQELRRTVEQADGLEQIFARHMKERAGKYIVFCSGKAHMEEMKAHIREWFALVDEHPHVYTIYFDSAAAQKEFAAFKQDTGSHLKLLFCIDMLNEGVHVGDIDGVILLRPTVSPILYLQQIGRALSAGSCRKPVIFDIVNNFESLGCIDSLAAEMETALWSMREETGQAKKFQDRFQIIDEVKDCRKLFLQLKKNLSASWDIYYAAASDYRRLHGSLKVPKSYVTDSGLTLGSWIQTQRRIRAGKINGRLTEEQIQKLDELGMIWAFPAKESWKRGYHALSVYCQKYGDADVKADYVTEDGYRLGKWVSNIRQKKKHGELALEKIQCLDELGMIWDKNSYLWGLNYQAAKQYYEIHGNLQVPASYCTKDGICLGNWIQNLKQIYAGKKLEASELSEEQIRQMEAIGMEWGNKSVDAWQKNYALASRYYREHGNLEVPCEYCMEGVNLGKWISVQRRRYRSAGKEKPLTAGQIQKLEQIDMNWTAPQEAAWEGAYKKAEAYFGQTGNLEVPGGFRTDDGFRLGVWLKRQKEKYRNQTISVTQKERLEAIGIQWERELLPVH